jgi:ribose transport system permease protein
MMRRHIDFQVKGILIAFVLMIVILSLTSPYFLSTENIFSVMRSFSFVAIMALGVTMVIISGGIDLSIGSVLGLCGCLTALLLRAGWSEVPAVLAGLAAGACIGLFNASLITYLVLPPFIVTLGTLSIARGLTFVITNGWPVSGFSASFMSLGQGHIWIIPIPVIVMMAGGVIAWLFLNQVVTGRYIYAIGSNETAARLSGVPVERVKCLVYSISGFMAALAGILLISRLGVAQTTTGTGYELDAIAASVIGGTSLMGGSGSVAGVIIGAAIMGVLRNGLILLGVSAFWQQCVLGCVIIMAVAIDRYKK